MTFYLQANLLLLVSYALFELCFRAARGAGTFRPWVVAAQALVLTSVLAPVALSLLPTQTLPRLEFRVANPLRESGPRLPKSPASIGVPALERRQEASRGRPNAWAFFNTRNLAFAWLMFLLVGASGLLGRLALRLRGLFRIAENGIQIRRLGRVRIVVSDRTSTPFSALLGRRALIVVPTAILASSRDYAISVRHELQHHRQRDTAWAILVEALEALFFFNPFIYLWKRRIAELQEFLAMRPSLARDGSPRGNTEVA